MENFIELYKEETKDLLNEVQDTLLDLEERPDDRELIDKVFRAMHNMKGNGAMFGFDNISAFTHDIETIYDKVRDGELPVTTDLINLTLEACDQINLMLLKPGADLGKQQQKADQILQEFAKLLPEEISPKDDNKKSGQSAKHQQKNVLRTFLIHFVPPAELFMNGTDPVLLLRELLELGESIVIAHNEKIPDFAEFDPQRCYLHWTIILRTKMDMRAVQDVFIFVEDESEIEIEQFQLPDDLKDLSFDQLKERILAKGQVTFEEICQFFKIKAKCKDRKLENASEKDSAAASKSETSIASQHVQREKNGSPSISKEETRDIKVQKSFESISGIRVSSEKLDNLINLVGELVTIQASLSQQVIRNNDSLYLPIAEALERLTAGLRDIAMEIRMVPLGTLFSKYKRLVRDLSRSLAKEVDLIIEGGETELDKTIIDKLGDPLVHLVRNAVDHGIEDPDIREKKGKSRKGTIRISAFQSGADVSIQISDDGKGMNPDKIFDKAVEKGIVAPDAKLSREEIFQLIFQPGFSTAAVVSDVSGRGVGMDVVKKNIEELRGTVDVESEIDRETIITLKLPLTLGIIDGLVVRVGESKFVLPISVVQDCHEFSERLNNNFKQREIINLRGEVLPFIRLRTFFSMNGALPNSEYLIIVNSTDARVGLVVDEIETDQQIVIKSLGKFYKKVEGVSGATILGDGSVALILDVTALYKAAAREEMNEIAAML